MNGNPTKAQSNYHKELREMYPYYELHHPFGSKRKFKGHGQVGEWIVVMLSHELHCDIRDFSFEEEKAMFFNQQAEYEKFHGKPSPVPKIIADIYRMMRHRHEVFKGFPCID
jgi:hypothetical protein